MSRGDGKRGIRNSVLGADRAFKVIDGGGAKGGAAGRAGGDDDCPVVALGHADGIYYFLDLAGQPRKLSARDLGNRNSLLGLFGGDDTWPRLKHPVKKEIEDENGNKVEKVVDFRINALAQDLIARAFRKGLWGRSITLRQPGVWRGEDGLPVVHCGDAVLVGDTWEKPGLRTGKQIWAAAEAIPRPDIPSDPSVAVALQESLQSAWNYKNSAAGIAILGLLYSGWLCGALSWRLNGFVTGPTGSGKTSLMRVIRAAWLVHDYSNDTSKAGMEQTIANRAIPSLIDEASDRNNSAGRDLLDIVLSSSGDEGTKLARGTVDGKGRTAEIVSSVIMFSIYPPPLQPQHMGRFVLIELQKPGDGADNRDEHRRIAEFARKHAAGLWGRAIGALERYNESLKMFRAQLADAGCSPREMDSKGALLAGWYVMTNDGLPNDEALRGGVAALGQFLVTDAEAEGDDAPRLALEHLIASQVYRHRSTDKEQVGELLETAHAAKDDESEAWGVLARNGIRAVRACLEVETPAAGKRCECSACFSKRAKAPVPRCAPCECATCQAKRPTRPPPRIGQERGLWIAKRHPGLDEIFRGSDFENQKWLTAISRHPCAQAPAWNVRIGAYSGRAIWLPGSALFPPSDPDPP